MRKHEQREAGAETAARRKHKQREAGPEAAARRKHEQREAGAEAAEGGSASAVDVWHPAEQQN